MVLLALSSCSAQGALPLTLLWLPLVWLPLLSGSLALTWLLSALGVYVRDLGQVLGIVVSMLMFLSAVFYPLSALPVRWQPLLLLNPLVAVIEQTRDVAVKGLPPSAWPISAERQGCWDCWPASSASAAFQKARRGFADVL